MPSTDREAAGKPYEPQARTRLWVTKPLCRDSGSVLILEGTDHHCDDHADDAHERDHCEVLDVVKAPDLCSQQADACDYPNVVIDAAAQRTQGADGIQGQAAESKSTRHEKAEISELDQVAPHFVRAFQSLPSQDLQTSCLVMAALLALA